MLIVNKNEILAKVNAEGAVFADDHHSGKVTKLDGYIMLNSGDICPVFANRIFCLNPLYLKNGELHLSQASVAGNIDLRNNKIEDAVSEYNASMQEIIDRLGQDYESKLIVDFKVF